MSRLTVLCSLLLLSVSTAALAQSPCPTQEILGSAAKRSSDLVCIVPQVYGPARQAQTFPRRKLSIFRLR